MNPGRFRIVCKAYSRERLYALVSVVERIELLVDQVGISEFSHVYDSLSYTMDVAETGSVQWRAFGATGDVTHLHQPYIMLECGLPQDLDYRVAVMLHELAHLCDKRNWTFESTGSHDAYWRNCFGVLVWLFLSVNQHSGQDGVAREAMKQTIPPVFPSSSQAEDILKALAG